MHSIEIFGYEDREICVGCDGHCGEGPERSDSGNGGCAPGARRPTGELVQEFKSLIAASPLDLEVAFYEATEENLERNGEVKKLLSMVDLSPAIVLDGKLLFFGGFSPEGLVQEVVKRLP